MYCPRCASSDVRESRRYRFLGAVYRLLGYQSIRCRSCRKRSWVRISEENAPASAPERKNYRDKRRFRPPWQDRHKWMLWKQKRRPILIRRALLISALIVAVLVFLHFLSQPPA